MKHILLFIVCFSFIVASCANAPKPMNSATSDVNHTEQTKTATNVNHKEQTETATDVNHKEQTETATEQDQNASSASISAASQESYSPDTVPELTPPSPVQKNLLTTDQIKDVSSESIIPKLHDYVLNGGDQKKLDEALMEACKFGIGQMILELLRNGANPNIRHKSDKKTPLIMAVTGSPSVSIGTFESTVTVNDIQSLIDAGADINATDKEGKTALMYACANSNEKWDRQAIVELLIKSGASVTIKDQEGRNALFYIQPEYATQEIIQEMSKHGADINAKNNKGDNVLISLHRNNNNCSELDKIYTILINAGINVNAKDKSGKTALFHAVNSHCRDCVIKLIEADIDVNAKDRKGKTVIEYISDDHDLAGLLISNGAKAKPLPSDYVSKRHQQ